MINMLFFRLILKIHSEYFIQIHTITYLIYINLETIHCKMEFYEFFPPNLEKKNHLDR